MHTRTLICTLYLHLVCICVCPWPDAHLQRLLRLKRVIGGQEVSDGQWPWLVSIQAAVPEGWLGHRRYFCGASLLNDRWLLTAAHCFRPKGRTPIDNPGWWHARLGDTELKHGLLDRIANSVGDIFGQVLDIDDWKDWYLHFEKIVVHPAYNPKKRWENDLALVKLKESVPSGPNDVSNIQRVKLPKQSDYKFPADGAECVMKGWGCTQSGDSVSEKAMQVILPKVSDYTCARFWGVSTKTRLCAGYNLQKKGICPGDSGGPLSCKNSRADWVQVGIASFTSSARPGQVPGAFTRVAHYVNWINKWIQH